MAYSLLTGQFEQPDSAESGEPGSVAELVRVRPVSDPIRILTNSATTPEPVETTARVNVAAALLPGPANLNSQTTSRGLYFESVARIGVQVADALEYAHRQGILHRDIKPSNLLLDTRGTVWVTDFGLAKGGLSGSATSSGEREADITQSGDVVGTLRYIAPERFQGESHARGDIYSLGLTLYELLTMQAAFQETDRGRLIREVTQLEPPLPRKLDARIPRDLETIVLKACAKEPARRYQSAAELADDLRRFLADRPIQARRSSAAEQLWRWSRRNPLVSGLAAALMIVVTLGSTAYSLSLRAERNQTLTNLGRALKAEGVATDRLGEVQQANQVVEASLKDVKRAEAERSRQLFDSLLNQARARRWSKRAGQRFESLTALTKAAELVSELNLGSEPVLELRNEAIAAMSLADVRVSGGWWELPIDVARTPVFDSKLERFVCLTKQHGLCVSEVGGRELSQLPAVGACAESRDRRGGRAATAHEWL